MLNLIADTEVLAAKRALLHTPISDKPERELSMAIQALRLAFERYLASARRTGFLQQFADSVASSYSLFIGKPATYTSAAKAIQTSLILASLYAVLKEKQLCSEFLSASDRSFEYFKEHHENLYRRPTRPSRGYGRKNPVDEELRQMRSGLVSLQIEIKNLL